MAAFYFYPKNLPEAKYRTNFFGRDFKTTNTDPYKWLLVTILTQVCNEKVQTGQKEI